MDGDVYIPLEIGESEGGGFFFFVKMEFLLVSNARAITKKKV